MDRRVRTALTLAIALPFVVAQHVPASAQLFGLGKFKVDQSDDRFSTSGLMTYSGLNNRISKRSVVGGVHIDAKGMFVEPVTIKRKADGSIVGLSFFVHNETDYDTGYGTPNSIGTPQRITFLTDGGVPIALTISNANRKWGGVLSYNSISRSASSRITETGFAELTPAQFERIMGATSIAVKIEGSERSVVYEAKDISKTFLPNLKAFYTSSVAAKP